MGEKTSIRSPRTEKVPGSSTKGELWYPIRTRRRASSSRGWSSPAAIRDASSPISWGRNTRRISIRRDSTSAAKGVARERWNSAPRRSETVAASGETSSNGSTSSAGITSTFGRSGAPRPPRKKARSAARCSADSSSAATQTSGAPSARCRRESTYPRAAPFRPCARTTPGPAERSSTRRGRASGAPRSGARAGNGWGGGDSGTIRPSTTRETAGSLPLHPADVLHQGVDLRRGQLLLERLHLGVRVRAVGDDFLDVPVRHLRLPLVGGEVGDLLLL